MMDVTDITDVAGVTDVTDITGGTVRHMASLAINHPTCLNITVT